jgi:hypothetical protein
LQEFCKFFAEKEQDQRGRKEKKEGRGGGERRGGKKRGEEEEEEDEKEEEGYINKTQGRRMGSTIPQRNLPGDPEKEQERFGVEIWKEQEELKWKKSLGWLA